MDKSIENAFAVQSFTGYWKIQHKDYPNEYFGEFLYDPIKGRNELTLYGICIPPIGERPQISAITGDITTGKKVSIFGLGIKNSCSGTGGILKQKTVFSFLFCCIGDTCFTTKESIRLRKCSFRCTNLEGWSVYQPIKCHFSSAKTRELGTIDLPAPLIIYEDEIIRIKLSTTIKQNATLYSLSAYYFHEVIIEAKGNRKLPFFGDRDSFSYYENVIHSFLGLMIGKKAVSFHRIGTIEKKRVVIPPEVPTTHSRKKMYDFKKVECYNSRTVEESWLEEISCMKILFGQWALDDEALRQVIINFTKIFTKIDFVLDDWIAMRNRSSYTNHSLPELLYNLEGLHRVLYPECDTNSGYKDAINAINAISPFEKYDQLINNKKHELPFKQRMQDILFIKTAPIYPYLTVSQKKDIIDYLHGVRDNAAHQLGRQDLCSNKLFPCILLCEELIAIMIFMNIGLQAEKILTVLRRGQEWYSLKDMLCEEFGSGEDGR